MKTMPFDWRIINNFPIFQGDYQETQLEIPYDAPEIRDYGWSNLGKPEQVQGYLQYFAVV
jgi:hypothetical protein